MQFPKDEHGEYRVLHRWIYAHAGKYSYYYACELREYMYRETRVHQDEPKYLHEIASPEIIALHSVYLTAAQALGL